MVMVMVVVVVMVVEVHFWCWVLRYKKEPQQRDAFMVSGRDSEQ